MRQNRTSVPSAEMQINMCEAQNKPGNMQDLARSATVVKMAYVLGLTVSLFTLPPIQTFF
jgi:hypothetical protein